MYDLGLFLVGVIAGYFFIDFYKSARFMLELPPILVLFLIAGGIYWFGKLSPTRLPADVIAGFGIGLGIRNQTSPT